MGFIYTTNSLLGGSKPLRLCGVLTPYLTKQELSTAAVFTICSACGLPSLGNSRTPLHKPPLHPSCTKKNQGRRFQRCIPCVTDLVVVPLPHRGGDTQHYAHVPLQVGDVQQRTAPGQTDAIGTRGREIWSPSYSKEPIIFSLKLGCSRSTPPPKLSALFFPGCTYAGKRDGVGTGLALAFHPLYCLLTHLPASCSAHANRQSPR